MTAAPGPQQPDEVQCAYEFAPGVRCQVQAGHDEPYYPYLDRGQWGEYSSILSAGSPHLASAPAPPLPPREQWTGHERKDTVRNPYAAFFPAAPSAQPDEVCTCPMNGPTDEGCEVHNPYTPAQPVRDTGEGRR